MNIKEILGTILISVITNGTVLALFVFVFKKLFETSLELANKKQYYQFSKLYDEQAQVVKEVYAEIVHMSDQVAYLAYHYNLLETHPELFDNHRTPKNGDPAKWERFIRATLTKKTEDDKSEELATYTSKALTEFKKKRIYFSKKVADEIERLMNLILFVASEFQNVTYRDSDNFKPVVASEVIEAWIRSVEATNKLFPVLENLFRAHLGINE